MTFNHFPQFNRHTHTTKNLVCIFFVHGIQNGLLEYIVHIVVYVHCTLYTVYFIGFIFNHFFYKQKKKKKNLENNFNQFQNAFQIHFHSISIVYVNWKKITNSTSIRFTVNLMMVISLSWWSFTWKLIAIFFWYKDQFRLHRMFEQSLNGWMLLLVVLWVENFRIFQQQKTTIKWLFFIQQFTITTHTRVTKHAPHCMVAHTFKF